MRTSFFDIENWREIGATLARNKTRTFLTAFGIFWGTAMLAMLFGGAHGFEGVMRRNFAGFSTNLGGCFANRRTEPYKGFNKGSSWGMT
ncbi:MAG: ABC transporter permease, partial [Muribaculaceae bacterium]|nr:ABC transporter permease [Muribaculaceae bacterium]